MSWANYRNDEACDLDEVMTDALADPTIIDAFCQIYDQLGYWTQPE